MPVSAALGVRSGRRILFIYIASVLVYFIFIQYLTGGRTLGKALCRVRLVREDGGRPKVLAGGGALYIALPHFAGRALGGL